MELGYLSVDLKIKNYPGLLQWAKESNDPLTADGRKVESEL